MRRYWPIIAVPLGAIAIAALVGIVRRDSLTSTPGEVVEDFLGHIVRDRYEKAARFVADGSATPQRLKEWRESVENGLGEVRHVRGETDWISGEEAEATGVLVAEQRERRLRFALEREEGRWRIARLDEFWGNDASNAAAPVRVREGWRERRRTRSSGRLR